MSLKIDNDEYKAMLQASQSPTYSTMPVHHEPKFQNGKVQAGDAGTAGTAGSETDSGTGTPGSSATPGGTTAPPMPSYDSSWQDKQSEMLAQIQGREPFSFSLKDNPLYQQYADRYIQGGRMAMRDSMGQAAALTGGYGSSYGQAVGQQQYDAYLQSLNDVVPELYGQAYEQWQDEGDRLMQQYSMLGEQAQTAYGQYRDQLGDWQYERAWDKQLADDEYSRQLAHAQELAQYGDFSGYEGLYSPEQIEAMLRTWIAANPDLAYNNGTISADQYKEITGKYPKGYKKPGGGGGGESYGGGSNKNSEDDDLMSELMGDDPAEDEVVDWDKIWDDGPGRKLR